MRSEPSSLIRFLRDAGIKLCDYAIERHEGGAYGEPSSDLVREWKERKEQVREFCAELLKNEHPGRGAHGQRNTRRKNR